MDSDGKEVEKWTSVKGKAHVIKKTPCWGKTYTLREEFAPYGYLQAEEVKFTVSDTADVPKSRNEGCCSGWTNHHQLKKVNLSRKLPGKICWQAAWTQQFGYVTGSLKDVTFEIYAAEDIKAADWGKQ